ncbi:TonB family protein [Mucilaginibacter aquatilis]|uniref:TonB family protein n=1 Tax=Mucilaginibacter aquatilis TaxID=1517760 RepID=A0A6I4IQS6_9SPHI|nr:TonB family protein [Mucilaginibacter aquatilis]MVN92223.1 TonB family protein [Mucilaginibacter aquatilis]
MSNKTPDILLIQKYLNGELDARAMHELERRALNDPFLAEALEGYQLIEKSQESNLAELQRTLQQRIEPKQKRVSLWPAFSIAASILVFLSIGGWWLLNYRPAANQPKLPAADKTTVVKNKPAVSSAPQQFKQEPIAVIKPSAPATQRFVQPSPVTEANEAVASSAIEDDVQMRFLVPGKDTSAKMKSKLLTADVFKAKKELQNAHNDSLLSKTLPQALAGRIAGIQVKAAPITSPQIVLRGTSSYNKQANQAKIITGQILDEDGKQPLAGVTVKVNSSGLGVNTDAQGRFKIAATDKDELSIAFIGYNTQQVKLGSKDSLNVILKQNHQSLSEVMAIGYGRPREPQEVLQEAHPADGWQNLYNYLNKEARVSNGQTGVVRLSFIVGTNGTLNDFEVLKSMGAVMDEKAIDLIKNGPRWRPNANGKPETVKLRVRFRKE